MYQFIISKEILFKFLLVQVICITILFFPITSTCSAQNCEIGEHFHFL